MLKNALSLLAVALAASSWALVGLCDDLEGMPASGTFRDCNVCPEMVDIPAGAFLMGSPSSEGRPAESPQRLVTVKRMAVGRFEVTFDEWDACTREGGCSHAPDDRGWGRGRRPAIHVSWNDAKQYLGWLSRKTGRRYRLLTESEWEYVARAGTTTAFAFSDFITPQQANYYTRQTAPVGNFSPNRFGIYDMHGNVWEWTEDCWNDSYAGAPANGAARTSGDCSRHVVRGGSWDDYPWYLRSAERSSAAATIRLNDLGFRAAMDYVAAPMSLGGSK